MKLYNKILQAEYPVNPIKNPQNRPSQTQEPARPCTLRRVLEEELCHIHMAQDGCHVQRRGVVGLPSGDLGVQGRSTASPDLLRLYVV